MVFVVFQRFYRLLGLVLLASSALVIGCSDDAGVSPAEQTPVLTNRTEQSQPSPEMPPTTSNGSFVDVTLSAGILARHWLPTDDLTNIVDSVGAGAAFADLDNDGWLDLIVTGGARSPATTDADNQHTGVHIYKNLKNGRFQDVTATSGIAPNSYAVGVAVADIDGDGDRDIYFVARGRNQLYINNGQGHFQDMTTKMAVGDEHFSTGAAFFDLDNDGDLDLYVTNYLDFDPTETTYYAPDGFSSPLAYKAQADVLYKNNGDGSFANYSVESGISAFAGRGMSVATLDLDNDQDIDIFVANDATENFLFLNDGNGKFTEQALLSGVATGANGEQTAAMAISIGDLNRDGRPDMTVSDTAYGALYMQMEPALFDDHVSSSGISILVAQYVSWGQNLIDYDNDGDLDLFTANGGLHHLVGWEDLLLENDGKAKFVDVSQRVGPYFELRHISRSSIVGDYDNDGDMDIFVTTLAGRHVLLRNDAKPAAWIKLDLVGVAHRDAFGAHVEIAVGKRKYTRQSRFPSAYLGQEDARLHFGLGVGVKKIDRIVVTWPNGKQQALTDISANQIVTIKEAL